MLDIADALHTWCGEGRDFAVATVVGVGGSAPRQPGAALAVDAAGEVVGSVSGGCVEGAVYELCQQALESGESARETFGYSDEDAFAVGLTCGGIIDILVTPFRADSPWRALLAETVAAARAGGTTALVRIVDGADGPAGLLGAPLRLDADGGVTGTLGGGAELDATAVAESSALLATGRTTTVTVGADGRLCGRPVTLLVESSVPPPRMLVFGAIDFAAALVRVGKFLGYHVTVCDARPVFATARRFPEADEIVVDWPHRYLDSQRPDARTVVCVLTHDTKFDVPLLERALRMPLAYVGAMGSRRTHLDRLDRLRAAGVTETELAALRSPIGLDLGARTPEETALSIAAEIVASHHGGSGSPLTGAHTPIHHERGPVVAR